MKFTGACTLGRLPIRLMDLGKWISASMHAALKPGRGRLGGCLARRPAHSDKGFVGRWAVAALRALCVLLVRLAAIIQLAPLHAIACMHVGSQAWVKYESGGSERHVPSQPPPPLPHVIFLARCRQGQGN